MLMLKRWENNRHPAPRISQKRPVSSPTPWQLTDRQLLASMDEYFGVACGTVDVAV